MLVNDVVEVIEGAAGQRFRCSRCGEGLGRATDNYRLHAALEESPVEDGNPHIGDPGRYVDCPMVLRRYYCPGCGVLLDTEVARAEDPPLWDIELAPKTADGEDRDPPATG